MFLSTKFQYIFYLRCLHSNLFQSCIKKLSHLTWNFEQKIPEKYGNSQRIFLYNFSKNILHIARLPTIPTYIFVLNWQNDLQINHNIAWNGIKMERANCDMIRDCISASVISIMKQQKERWNAGGRAKHRDKCEVGWNLRSDNLNISN